MLPVKERTIRGHSSNTHKTVVGTGTKFKVYSETSKVYGGRRGDNVADANSLRTSVVSKKSTMLSSNTCLKDHANGVEENRGSHESHDKMKLPRRPLADVSNIRRNSSRVPKPVTSRSSLTFGTLNSSASTSKPPLVKVKGSITRNITASGISVKTITKTLRTSSNFQGVEVTATKESMARAISRSNSTITRNSFPALKKPSQLGSRDLQGGIKHAEKAVRKTGFPVKTRVGGKLVPEVSNLKGYNLKDRLSDSLIRIASRDQTDKDARQGLRKSVKPVARTTSQNSVVQRKLKSKSISGLDKYLGTNCAGGVKLATSSIPKTLASVGSDGNITERGNPGRSSHISETKSSKKCGRRKSYTSLLISRSKLLGQNIEDEEKLPNIDDAANPLEVAEYVDDIYQYYWIVEGQSTSLETYMTVQTDVTPQMRSILINWLIEVHFKFDLMPETLYLAVALLDRYLSLVPIKKRELQLVGLTSLLLASKYEDFWHPRVKDLISISAETYTRKQILEMEKDMLKKLRFRLNLPTAYVFMLRFLKASQSEKQLEYLAFYLIELCLVEYEALKFRPSLLCASTVYVARCTLKKFPAWTPLLGRHAHYDELEIRDCAEIILRIHKAASESPLNVTYEKYKRPEFGGVTVVTPLDSLP